jgi:outer membrane biosynthesis protein TonB
MPDKMPREGYIVNPKTGRYIKMDGPTAKKLFKSGEIPRPAKDCPPGKVHNPKTGRCIDINGALAKKLGLNKKPEAGAGAAPPPQAEPKPEKPKKEPKAPKPPKEPKAPKPPKEPKAPKPPKEPKAPKAPKPPNQPKEPTRKIPILNEFNMPEYNTMARNQIYAVLGVTVTADDDMIKKAYRTLMRKYHPDKQGSSEEAKNISQEIATAYNVLKNKEYTNYYNANKMIKPYDKIINDINRMDQLNNQYN